MCVWTGACVEFRCACMMGVHVYVYDNVCVREGQSGGKVGKGKERERERNKAERKKRHTHIHMFVSGQHHYM